MKTLETKIPNPRTEKAIRNFFKVHTKYQTNGEFNYRHLIAEWEVYKREYRRQK